MKNSVSLLAAIAGGAACCWAVLAPEKFESAEDLIVRYRTDRDALAKFYGWNVLSESHRKRMEAFYSEWSEKLAAMDFDELPQARQVDYVLMEHRLDYRKKALATGWRKLTEIAELLEFKDGILELYESSRRHEKMQPRATPPATIAASKETEFFILPPSRRRLALQTESRFGGHKSR